MKKSVIINTSFGKCKLFYSVLKNYSYLVYFLLFITTISCGDDIDDDDIIDNVSVNIPGVVINHIPASSKTYIGSPSICILPNENYVASHDFFGSVAIGRNQSTAIFYSSDKGNTWNKISEIKGQFWSNLFVHKNDLYLMGVGNNNNLTIRRSFDGGVSWSEPIDSKSGIIRKGEYHTAPMPIVSCNGRLWRAVEFAETDTESSLEGLERLCAMVVSIPEDANLLHAENWVTSNYVPYDSTYLDGNFGGWLEGNVVAQKNDEIIDMLRVETSEKGRDMVATVKIDNEGLKATFDPSNGFMDFVGGARKFTIRYDSVSDRYWTICNMLTEEFYTLPAASVRNTLVLKSSADLINWTVHEILIQHPDVKKHGFQYVDWQFENQDIIFVSRTACDDQFGGAHNFHDSNYMTFHRITNFRDKIENQILDQ